MPGGWADERFIVSGGTGFCRTACVEQTGFYPILDQAGLFRQHVPDATGGLGIGTYIQSG